MGLPMYLSTRAATTSTLCGSSKLAVRPGAVDHRCAIGDSARMSEGCGRSALHAFSTPALVQLERRVRCRSRGSMLVLAVVAGVGCTSSVPINIKYYEANLGHYGPISGFEFTATRTCEVTFVEPGRLARHGKLASADCARLFKSARGARLSKPRSCRVAQAFEAGLTIRFSNGSVHHGCSDDPFARDVARLAERYAPTLRSATIPAGMCDPIECPRDDASPFHFQVTGWMDVDAGGCKIEAAVECRRDAAGACSWQSQRKPPVCPTR
jgi:hypothetical protein